MIGGRKLRVSFCLVPTVFLALAGCTTVDNSSFVAGEERFSVYDEESVTYKVDPEAGAKTYLVDTEINKVEYIATHGKLVRITPEKPESLSADEEQLDPVEAEFKAADTPQLLAAFVEKYAPTALAFEAVQQIARPFIDDNNWPAAIEAFDKYRKKFPYYEEKIDKIIAILEASEEGLKVVNLGSGVNTKQSEYSPVISSDGKRIYFARDCGECSGGEEVHIADKKPDGGWGNIRRFGEPLSSRGHEIPLGISSDNTVLAVYGHYPGNLGRGDIFFIEKNHNGWGQLQHYPEPLNSKYFDSNAMYTADGKAILFISERPGGVGDYHEKGAFHNGSYTGNTDIYVYLGDGDKGEIINLGPVINTPAGEYSPFLHPDGKTLYFSSNGHAGLGGLDVYKSTRLSEDSWTDWTEPVNLGKEVNTPYDDWGYQVAAEGTNAYFAKSSDTNNYGKSDIYSISLPEKAKPSGVITVSGVVTDPKGDPLVAEIRWDDLEKQKEVGYANSDPITGEYVIHLPYGANYGYYAEKPGYMGESEHFDLRKYADSYREFVLDIVLYPIVKPVSVQPEPIAEPPVVELRMNNIFFDFDKTELRPESHMEMNRWIRMLKENGQISLHISGHADNVGTERYNKKLSEKRARAVVGYLIENGIDNDRLIAEGFGETKPVADNDTPEGRQRNRRVQVKILNSAQ